MRTRYPASRRAPHCSGLRRECTHPVAKAARGSWSARIRRRRAFVKELFWRCIRAGVWALLRCQTRDFGVQQPHWVFRIIDGYREYLAIM